MEARSAELSDVQQGAGPGAEAEAAFSRRFIIRVMPPVPVYDHKSMRETGRPKPHLLNPSKPTHTLCGKPTPFWRLLVEPIGEFDRAAFRQLGCANCSRAIEHLIGARDGGGEGDAPTEARR